jgi:hypothetical protein
MAFVLFIGGALVLMAGVASIGFGMPINEFSFGNALIVSGAVAAVGGLILLALGVVVSKLVALTEALAGRAPSVAQQGSDIFDAAPARGADVARRSFPPRTKPDLPGFEPAPLAPSMTDPAADATSAPGLRNPDQPAETGAVDLPPPPRPSRAAAADEPPPRRATGSFEAMWPTPASKPAAPFSAESKSDRKAERPPRPEPDFAPPAPGASESRAVEILKSGVVDGMGYTLYVDGSIEAELPQGTLRFSSINDLRAYLAKNA